MAISLKYQEVSAVIPPSLGDYVAHATRKRLTRMLKHAEGIRNERHPASVRQMRVWSRRTRAALDVAAHCFGSDPLDGLRRKAKSITRSLGRIRDLDVTLEALSHLGESLPPGQDRCLEPLIVALGNERRECELQAVRAVERFEAGEPLQRLENAVAGGEVSKRDLKAASGLDGRSPALNAAARFINARIDELLEYERYIFQPDRVAELHEARTAVKRLRYTMELFEYLYTGLTPYGNAFAEALSEVEALQERLGTVHDADVLAPMLRAELDSVRDRVYGKKGRIEAGSIQQDDLDACQGLLAVCSELRSGRNRDYDLVVRDWCRLREEGFFADLRGLLRKACSPASVDSRRNVILENARPALSVAGAY